MTIYTLSFDWPDEEEFLGEFSSPEKALTYAQAWAIKNLEPKPHEMSKLVPSSVEDLEDKCFLLKHHQIDPVDIARSRY